MSQPGLQDLPLELLQEIINHIPDLPFPFTPQSTPENHVFPFLKKPLSTDEPRVQRTSTLRSLSQTCRLLRELARPLAWEVIEVVSVRKRNAEEKPKMRTRQWYSHQLRKELGRQLRVVLGDESLRKNLRRVSVIVTESSAQVALEMFAAFPTFSELHTIQLLWLSSEPRGLWEKDLYSSLCNLDTPLRSVKNVVLPDYGTGLLRHCPSLEVVVATLKPRGHPYIERDVGRTILTEIFDHCPSVKFLQGLPLDWHVYVEPLVKGCPQLSYLCFDDTLYYGYNRSEGLGEQQARIRTFQELSALKQLRHITLVVRASGSFEIQPQHQLFIMHCIMLLGGVSGANIEECEDEENAVNPFTSPFPAALLPIWFLKKTVPREEASDQRDNSDTLVKPQDHGAARTLTIDINGIKRPIAIFSVAPPAEGNPWPRLLGMRVGYRSDDAFEELYDLIDIPLNIDRQPDPLSNVNLSRPQVFCHEEDSFDSSDDSYPPGEAPCSWAVSIEPHHSSLFSVGL